MERVGLKQANLGGTAGVLDLLSLAIGTRGFLFSLVIKTESFGGMEDEKIKEDPGSALGGSNVIYVCIVHREK